MSPLFDNDARLDARRNPRQMLLETALVLLVFALQGAWPVPDVNESVYLPKLKHAWDPGWAAKDFYLNSADAHGVFGLVLGWPTRLLSLPAFAWTGRLLTWGLLAWAWQRLSAALVPYRWLSVLTAGLFVCLQERGQMAGEWVIGGFEAKGLAYACVFVGLICLVRNRWNLALMALGAATALHGLVGGWSLVALVVAWLLEGPARPRLTTLWPGLLAAVPLAALGIWPAIAMNADVSSDIMAEANRIYVYQRLMHHLLPQAFRSDMVLRHVILAALLLGLWATAPRGEGRYRLLSFAIGAVLIAAAGWLIALATAGRPELSASLLRYYWFRLADAMVPLGVALGIVASAAAAARLRPYRASWSLGIVAGIASLHLAGYAIDRLYPTRPRADKENKIDDYVAWRHLTNWVARHTPDDALFLTPRSQQTFNWYTGRSEVVTWKNIPQNASGIVEWWGRLNDIYGQPAAEGPESWHDSLVDVPIARLQQLAGKYGFEYMVMKAEPPMPLPVVYRNETYVVYRMPYANGSAP
jgi:hypothetical protein